MTKTLQLFKYSILVLISVLEIIMMDGGIGEGIMYFVAFGSISGMIIILATSEDKHYYGSEIPKELLHAQKKKKIKHKKIKKKKNDVEDDFRLFLDDYMKRNKRKV